MPIKKKIVDAKKDDKGNISAVKLEGNKTFTPIETAIGMTKRGKVDAVVVNPTNAKQHIRTKADGKKGNNLDTLAGD